MTSTFQRARSDEQRAKRRAVILTTAASMLTEMPVAEVSLNELSRRVGLAKSNVLRYFETREAVLLELLIAELNEWADELEGSRRSSRAGLARRIERTAELVSNTLAGRPTLCDLVSAQAGVLERNVSTEVVLRHKHATHAVVRRLQQVLACHLPELTEPDTYFVVATVLLMCSGAWPQSQPADAVAAAYAADPEIAKTQMNFTDWMHHTIRTSITGMIASSG